MKNSVYIASIFCCLFCVSAQAAKKFYVGFGVADGSSNAGSSQIVPLDLCTSCDLERDVNAYEFFVGVNWSRYTSLEIAYVDFAEVFSIAGQSGSDAVSVTQENYGVTLTEKLIWPINGYVSVYGKLGAIFWNGEVKYRRENQPTLANADSSVELSYGLGTSFRVMNSAQVAIEWQYFDKLGDSAVVLVSEDKAETLEVDVRQLSLRFWYDFDF